MSLSEKEKKRIREIENAVEEEKPVEDLDLERRKSKTGKLPGEKRPRMMGDMIPLEKRRPGLAEKLISSTQSLLGPTLMGLFIPPFGPGKGTPKKDDEPSEKNSKPRPERKKKKTEKDDEERDK